MILVVGATGMLGSLIARRLLAEGKQVRILARPGSDSADLVNAGAEAVDGDLKDPPSLERAVRSIETVVTTANSARRGPPDTVEAVDLHGNRALIDAAAAAGVSHFVFVSGAPETGADSPNPFIAAKGASEDHLRASGMAWTILAPEPYFEIWVNWIVAGPALNGDEVLYVGSGQHRHSMVSVHDVAAFATASVDNPAAHNRRLIIGGPEAISWRDAVEVFERVLGRPIQHRGVAPGQPIRDIPQQVLGILAFGETYDSPIETAPLADEFGVRQTSLEDYARTLAGR